jgi:hypothetical protein
LTTSVVNGQKIFSSEPGAVIKAAFDALGVKPVKPGELPWILRE